VDPELGDRPIVFQRSDDAQDEQSGEDDDNEEQAELECVMRQIQRSHVVAPSTMPVREEDRVLMKPLGDKLVHTLFDSIHDTHFFCLLSFSSRHDHNFDGRGHKR
jgi:hypothetical protein